jgi:type I restriction enzyme, R subunit
VRVAIRDFLRDQATGLPLESYSEQDIHAKSEEVFRHVYWAYPRIPSPIYGAIAHA